MTRKPIDVAADERANQVLYDALRAAADRLQEAAYTAAVMGATDAADGYTLDAIHAREAITTSIYARMR